MHTPPPPGPVAARAAAPLTPRQQLLDRLGRHGSPWADVPDSTLTHVLALLDEAAENAARASPWYDVRFVLGERTPACPTCRLTVWDINGTRARPALGGLLIPVTCFTCRSTYTALVDSAQPHEHGSIFITPRPRPPATCPHPPLSREAALWHLNRAQATGSRYSDPERAGEITGWQQVVEHHEGTPWPVMQGVTVRLLRMAAVKQLAVLRTYRTDPHAYTRHPEHRAAQVAELRAEVRVLLAWVRAHRAEDARRRAEYAAQREETMAMIARVNMNNRGRHE